MEATPRARQAPGRNACSHTHPMGEPPRPAPVSRLSAATGSCCQEPGGRPNKTERPHPRRRGHPINHHVAGAAPSPADPGKAGCSWPPLPGRHGWSPAQKGHRPGPLNPYPAPRGLPPPAAHYRLVAGRGKGACGAATRALRAPRPATAARTNRQQSGTGSRLGHAPRPWPPNPSERQTSTCGPEPMQVRRLLCLFATYG